MGLLLCGFFVLHLASLVHLIRHPFATRANGTHVHMSPILISLCQERLHGKTTIRFPADQPLTMHCVYEWLQPDGQWRPRVVAGFVDENADK